MKKMNPISDDDTQLISDASENYSTSAYTTRSGAGMGGPGQERGPLREGQMPDEDEIIKAMRVRDFPLEFALKTRKEQ